MVEQTENKSPLTEEEILQKEADLQIVSEKLKEDRDALEQEKADFEKQKAESTPREAIQEFEFEGENYAFAVDAPNVIRFGGQIFTREEISKNEAILIQLIGGDSSLIFKK